MNIKKTISNAIRKGHVEWKRHVLQRILERNINRDEVINALKTGVVIEEYPYDKPLFSCLIYNNNKGNPLHVVAAIDEKLDSIAIITVYRPDSSVFLEDLITRKRI